MCRNIRSLYNFDPPATNEEVQAAALQFVRKVSGFQKPSKVNEEIFKNSVDDITEITKRLLDCLTTQAHSRNREQEAAKAHLRAMKRYSSAG